MGAEVIINLGKISQILAAVGNFSYQVEHILTRVNNLSTSPYMTNEPNSQEIHKDFLCKNSEHDHTLGTTSEGEKPQIEEFSVDTLCNFEINQSEKGIYMT